MMYCGLKKEKSKINSPATQRREKRDVNLKNLPSWVGLPNNKVIVHTINKDFEDSPFFKVPAEDVFKTMDVISASLIDTEVIKKQRAFSRNNLMTSLDLKKYRQSYDYNFPYVFYEIGFVLEVSPENILGTFPHDVSFPNHVGTARTIHGPAQRADSYKLTDCIEAGAGKYGKQTEGGFDQISTPDDLLANTERKPIGRWNEIQVVGKENIALHADGIFSKKIKVKKIVCLPKLHLEAAEIREKQWPDSMPSRLADPHFLSAMKNMMARVEENRHEELQAIADKLSKLNPGIPIEFIE